MRMFDKSQLLRGTLEGCILKILSDHTTYGYEIVTKRQPSDQELKDLMFINHNLLSASPHHKRLASLNITLKIYN